MATHWDSCEVPKGARMISGASTNLTLAVKGRRKRLVLDQLFSEVG